MKQILQALSVGEEMGNGILGIGLRSKGFG
jgi:hypothetical protein